MYNHEMPSKLDVEDKMVWGMNGRQLAIVISGLASAYGAWSNLVFLPLLARGLMAALVAVATLALAFVRPGGDGLEDWFFAWVRFQMMPARAVWQPSAFARTEAPPVEETGFVELGEHDDVFA
ncbi:MAG: PrgI family protein [Actinomycetota bacterium]|nr:PrgI family protein [Actinomycetota bacterium]